MKHGIILFTGLILAWTMTANADDKKTTYKWHDSNGVIQYTQTPPADGISYQVISIKTNAPQPSSSSGGGNSGQNSAVDSGEAGQPEKLAVKTEAERKKKNCEISRQNLATLTNIARIRVPGENGSTRLLTDEERAAKLKDTEEQIKENCGS